MKYPGPGHKYCFGCRTWDKDEKFSGPLHNGHSTECAHVWKKYGAQYRCDMCTLVEDGKRMSNRLKARELN